MPITEKRRFLLQLRDGCAVFVDQSDSSGSESVEALYGMEVKRHPEASEIVAELHGAKPDVILSEYYMFSKITPMKAKAMLRSANVLQHGLEMSAGFVPAIRQRPEVSSTK